MQHLQPIPFPVIDLRPILTITMVLAWATTLLLVDAFLIPAGKKRITGYLGMVGLAVAAVVALAVGEHSGGEGADAPFGGMVVLDHFALVLTLIILFAGMISIALSLDYLPTHQIERGEYYPLVLFAIGGMIVLAQGNDLLMLFLGLELLSITLYILTAFAYPRIASEEAGMKYLLLGAFAAGFFVYGLALVFGGAHGVQLDTIRTSLQSNPDTGPMLALVGGMLIIIALSFKIALVPFHMWTPDVYEGAPTPVTAFMSVGTKAAALAAMARLLLLALPTFAPYWIPMLGILAALTMVVGNVGALVQTNIKRMLAYSSIGHAGYFTLGLLAADARGLEAVTFYLVAYVLTNLGAFGVVIALERRDATSWHLDDASGLWQRHGFLAIAMAIFMFSLAGMPPTAGFVAKFAVFAAAWESGNRLGWLVVIGLVTSAIAAFFYLRIIVRMFMHEPQPEVPPSPFFPRVIPICLGLTAVATLLFGLYPTPLVELIEAGSEGMIGTFGRMMVGMW